MASVTFDKATRLYPGGTRPAVDKLDLEVADGEFLVLVGPSGCGKSTSLRMLAGLEEVNEGNIFIGDRNVTDVPPKDRDIAMVFQNYALYPHMTVAENMGFALKIAGVGKDERAARWSSRPRSCSTSSPTSAASRRRSGGQRQRVAMGRAIVRQPQVFLMDGSVEPRRQAPRRPAPRSPRCSAASASPRSTSRTTRPRRSPWATASPC